MALPHTGPGLECPYLLTCEHCQPLASSVPPLHHLPPQTMTLTSVERVDSVVASPTSASSNGHSALLDASELETEGEERTQIAREVGDSLESLVRQMQDREPSNTKMAKPPKVKEAMKLSRGDKAKFKAMFEEICPSEGSNRAAALSIIKAISQSFASEDGPNPSPETFLRSMLEKSTTAEFQVLAPMLRSMYWNVTSIASNPKMVGGDRGRVYQLTKSTDMILLPSPFAVIPANTSISAGEFIPTTFGGAVSKERGALVWTDYGSEIGVHFQYTFGGNFEKNVPQDQYCCYIEVTHIDDLTPEQAINWPCDKLVVQGERGENVRSFISLKEERIPNTSPMAHYWGNIMMHKRSHEVFRAKIEELKSSRDAMGDRYSHVAVPGSRTMRERIEVERSRIEIERTMSRRERQLRSYNLSGRGVDRLMRGARRRAERSQDIKAQMRADHEATTAAYEAALRNVDEDDDFDYEAALEREERSNRRAEPQRRERVEQQRAEHTSRQERVRHARQRQNREEVYSARTGDLQQIDSRRGTVEDNAAEHLQQDRGGRTLSQGGRVLVARGDEADLAVNAQDSGSSKPRTGNENNITSNNSGQNNAEPGKTNLTEKIAGMGK